MYLQILNITNTIMKLQMIDYTWKLNLIINFIIIITVD